MRLSWILASLIILIMAGGPAHALDSAGIADRSDAAAVSMGWALLAQVEPGQTGPIERDIVEPEPVAPGEATPSELGIVGAEPVPETPPIREAPPAPEAVVECGPNEIAYAGGCIPKPTAQGQPLGTSGECPPGYFEYRGLCHPEPGEQDIRIP